MTSIEKIKYALEAAKAIAASKGETFQDWHYEVTPGQQPVYQFTDAEEKHMLQITHGSESIFLAQVLSHDEKTISAIAIQYDTTDIIELIITFFHNPEETYETLQDMEHAKRIF